MCLCPLDQPSGKQFPDSFKIFSFKLMHCSHAYSTLDMMGALVDGFCNMWQKNTICTVMKNKHHPPTHKIPQKDPRNSQKGWFSGTLQLLTHVVLP